MLIIKHELGDHPKSALSRRDKTEDTATHLRQISHCRSLRLWKVSFPAQVREHHFTCLRLFLFQYMMFNILLSSFVCAAASLFLAWLMKTHINVPVSLLELKMSRCLESAVQSAIILL